MNHETPATADTTLRSEIKAALNRAAAENPTGTPDHILADYLLACLAAYDDTVRARARWYGRTMDRFGQERPA